MLGMKAIAGVIVAIIFVWWAISSIQTKHIQSEKKPFWSGTETVQVCKRPYTSSRDCYMLPVTLLDEKNARINFPSGEYVYVYDIACWYAGQIVESDPRYVFCRSWDNEDGQIDFLPTWVNY